MLDNLTLSRSESNIRECFSGITLENIGQFCTETRNYVVNSMRNIPESMQESHLKAAFVICLMNTLFLIFINFSVLSPFEKQMEANTTDPDQLLWKKNILNVVAVGVGCIAFNISLTQLHKYKLSRIQLLLIAITVIVYRRFKLIASH